jgi:integrase
VVAATTGLRRSELLGLRWADVNVRGGTLAIKQIIIDGPDGYRRELDQKSVSSGRTIHLSRYTMRVLLEHRVEQASRRPSVLTDLRPDFLRCSTARGDVARSVTPRP